MRNRSFQLVIGLGLGVLVAYGSPACGGDSDSDTKSTGGKDAGTGGTTGGTGGTTGGTGGSTGGTGGSTGGTGATDAGTTITCVAAKCTSFNVVITELQPCCAGSAKDKCGVDIDDNLAGQIGIKGGCFELEQAGNLDPGCPDLTGVPLIGKLPGCCNTAGSKCSYQINISAIGGPDMGCVDPNNLPTEGGPPKACTPGQPSDAGSDAASDAASDAGSDATTDSASDAAGDAPADTTSG